MRTPIAYKGEEPYIFISYAHLDSELVLPIIARMQRDGFRIWYDEGIPPVEDWPQVLADRIDNCGFFLAFLSENYLASANCKDEIMYVRDRNKDHCLTYLSPVTLPGGMQLRLGRLQAIHWFAFTEADQAFEKLYEVDGIHAFRTPTTGEQDSPDACYDELEDLYRQGMDYLHQGKTTTAYNHLLAAAQLGHLQAQVEVGNCYRTGSGVARDLKAAAEWYLKAAQQGEPNAQYQYACCCQAGSGPAKDDAQAVEWLTLAAGQDHAQAQFELANCYCWGVGVPRDKEDAVYWYKRSAALGCAAAQYQMGHAKEYGVGTRRDLKAAARYYEQAGTQGHIDAQCALGRMYRESNTPFNGVKQDLKQAIYWYTLAADQGDSWARYCLAKCYLWGDKTVADRPRAKQLLLQAAACGDKLTRFYAQCNLFFFFFTLAPSKTRS